MVKIAHAKKCKTKSYKFKLANNNIYLVMT